jgi:hypothetical protein
MSTNKLSGTERFVIHFTPFVVIANIVLSTMVLSGKCEAFMATLLWIVFGVPAFLILLFPSVWLIAKNMGNKSIKTRLSIVVVATSAPILLALIKNYTNVGHCVA